MPRRNNRNNRRRRNTNTSNPRNNPGVTVHPVPGASDSDSDDELPPLVNRRYGLQGDADSDSNGDLPPLQARTVANHAGDSDSSGSAMPDLLPRTQAASSSDESDNGPVQYRPATQLADEDSDDDSDMPGLLRRVVDRNDMDGSSDSDSGMPDLMPPATARNGNGDSSDSGSDIPDLLPRAHAYSSSEDSDDEPPAMVRPHVVVTPAQQQPARGGGSDSDSDAMPSLLPRRADNSSSDEEDERPPRGARAADSDDDGMPVLLSRQPDDSSEDSESDDYDPQYDSDQSTDDDMPSLLSRTAGADSESDETDSEMPGLIPQKRQKTAANDGKKQPVSNEFRKKVREEGKKLKLSQLKGFLKKHNVDVSTFRDRQSLEDAYFDMRVAEEEAKPPPVDPFAGLPSLVSAHTPPKNGAWVLAPDGDPTVTTLFYAWTVGEEGRHVSELAKFDGEAMAVLGAPPGRLWVAATKGGTREQEVHQVLHRNVVVPMYTLPEPAVALVTSGSVLWSLSETGVLTYRSGRYPGGREVVSGLPSQARLFPTTSGGVWLVVPAGAGGASYRPGLWFVSKTYDMARVMPVPAKACLCSDAVQSGLWLLVPDSPSKLVYVSETLEVEKRSLDVPFENTQAIVDDGRDGVFVHYKSGNRWKLAHAVKNESSLLDVQDCPKTARIASDRNGGAWISKKAGKNAERSLMHVGSNVCEFTERYPSQTVLGGGSQ